MVTQSADRGLSAAHFGFKIATQPPQPLNRFAHQRILIRFRRRQIRHREAQKRSGVIPRQTAHRLLRDEKLGCERDVEQGIMYNGRVL
jgi:hypothetical protein